MPKAFDRVLRLKAASQERFLMAYRACGVISHACSKASISRETHYHWLEHEEEYGFRFHVAEKEAIETLEREAWRRAVEGVDKPIFYKGELIKTIREYSDVLLIFMIKANLPDKYREPRTGVTFQSGDAKPMRVLVGVEDDVP